MADYFTNISFGFEATGQQASALECALALCPETPIEDLSLPEDLARFVSKDQLRDMMEGDDEVSFGDVELERDGTTVYIYGSNPYLERLALLIQAVMKPEKPIGFQWSNDSSKHRLDAFGGGCCAIFKDRIVFENTATRLEALLDG